MPWMRKRKAAELRSCVRCVSATVVWSMSRGWWGPGVLGGLRRGSGHWRRRLPILSLRSVCGQSAVIARCLPVPAVRTIQAPACATTAVPDAMVSSSMMIGRGSRSYRARSCSIVACPPASSHLLFLPTEAPPQLCRLVVSPFCFSSSSKVSCSRFEVSSMSCTTSRAAGLLDQIKKPTKS